MYKILFIVNGLGMGNSTRCHSIIEKLVDYGYTVDVLTSGNGLEYFKQADINNLFKLYSLKYSVGNDGNISAIKTFLSIISHFITLFKNINIVNKIIKKGNYNGIVIDSDYTMLFLKWKIKIPLFAINNAHIIIQECNKLLIIPKNIKMQFIIEKLDNFFHNLIPDYVLSPSMKPIQDNKNIFNFLPFVRKEIYKSSKKSKNKKTNFNCLIMLSGSIFGSNIDFINNISNDKISQINIIGRTGFSSKGIRYYGKVLNNYDIISKADILIINAGFSAVSEAFIKGIPSIVMPVRNHAEQFINAKIFEELNLGYEANEKNIGLKLNLLIKNYNLIKNNYSKINTKFTGSNEASIFIKRKINCFSKN